jgi:hypothetical protein
VLDVENWAEVRRLRRAEGVAISEIARVMEIFRNTVKAALGADRPPRYQRVPRGSLVEGLSRGSGSCWRPIRRCRRTSLEVELRGGTVQHPAWRARRA